MKNAALNLVMAAVVLGLSAALYFLHLPLNSDILGMCAALLGFASAALWMRSAVNTSDRTSNGLAAAFSGATVSISAIPAAHACLFCQYLLLSSGACLVLLISIAFFSTRVWNLISGSGNA